MDVALSKCKLEKASHYKELLDKTEEAMGLYKMRFPVQEYERFQVKKGKRRFGYAARLCIIE